MVIFAPALAVGPPPLVMVTVAVCVELLKSVTVAKECFLTLAFSGRGIDPFGVLPALCLRFEVFRPC